MAKKVSFKSMVVLTSLLLILSFSSYGQGKKIKFEGLAEVTPQEILSLFALNRQNIFNQYDIDKTKWVDANKKKNIRPSVVEEKLTDRIVEILKYMETVDVTFDLNGNVYGANRYEIREYTKKGKKIVCNDAALNNMAFYTIGYLGRYLAQENYIASLPLEQRNQIRQQQELQRQQELQQQQELQRKQELQQQQKELERQQRAANFTQALNNLSQSLEQENYNKQQQQSVRQQQQYTQQQTGYVQPRQQTNNNSLARENDAKQIENEGASLARQTSDYSRAQAIRSTSTALANKVRSGELSLAQAQAQLRGSQTQQSNQTQQGMQVSGWYYTNPQYGNPTKTTVYLMIGQRNQSNGRDCYNIIGIKINGVLQNTSGYVGCYNRSNGLYVCQYNSYTIYFNM